MALQTGHAPCGTRVAVLDANTISLYPVYADALKKEKIMPLLKFKTAMETRRAFWDLIRGLRVASDFWGNLAKEHLQMGYGKHL